jgi:peptide chain release factor 3
MAGGSIPDEVKRRRTFAIISHPDAGKTTLTEKLLLFSGAIQIAGSVKARKASRHATSDWMEIEKQRGISVASSVMQFVHRDCVINLLDTPGHQDFSEDTYRVLTAVDAALMVIDAANGIESQTLRLLKICRTRNIPIVTFINKLDREVRAPLDLLDEIERELGMTPIPFTWPVGMGNRFRGVYDLRIDRVRRFRAGRDRDVETAELVDVNDPAQAATLGQEWRDAVPELELVRGASPDFDREQFIAARQTPVFFGSAINNFGVREVLDSIVDLVPMPGPKHADERTVSPDETKFSGVVFKVQANMDPQHRDRVAFVRVCSGRFERGMALFNARTRRQQRPQNVVTFLSQRRDLVDEAYPGDIIGIPNHGTLSLGDTLTEGETLHFSGLPFFAPESFRTIEVVDPMKMKQLRAALAQLGDEGAIQVFRQDGGSRLLLGAVGELQFEVVAHRLRVEYNVEARIAPAPYVAARWINGPDQAMVDRFLDQNAARVALDAADAPTYLVRSLHEITVAQERWPDLRFSVLRERGGARFTLVGHGS